MVLMVSRRLEVQVEVMERAATGSETGLDIQCSKNDDADHNHPLSSNTAITEVTYESDPLTPSPMTTKSMTVNKFTNTIVNSITKTTPLL